MKIKTVRFEPEEKQVRMLMPLKGLRQNDHPVRMSEEVFYWEI